MSFSSDRKLTILSGRNWEVKIDGMLLFVIIWNLSFHNSLHLKFTILEQVCPMEISTVIKYSISVLSNSVATNHMWPLNTWTMPTMNGELNLFYFVLNSHMCPVVSVLDHTALKQPRINLLLPCNNSSNMCDSSLSAHPPHFSFSS